MMKSGSYHIIVLDELTCHFNCAFNGDKMFLYWRVQQDLDCLDEVVIFHNPSFIRSYKNWIKKNASGILLAEGIDPDYLKLSGLN